MKKNKKRNERKDSRNDKYDKRINRGLQTHTKHGIAAVILFVLAVFFLMSAFNLAGVAGEFVYEKFYYLLGVGYILLPILFVLLGFSFLKSETPNIGWTRMASGAMFLLSGLGIIDIMSARLSETGTHSGGFFGEIASKPFMSLFDIYVSLVFLSAILVISILIMFDAKLDPSSFLRSIWNTITRKKPDPEELDSDRESLEDARDDSDESEETQTAGEKMKNALGLGKKSFDKAQDGSTEIEE